MIILNSARKHGISDVDMFKVANDPTVAYILRAVLEKNLLLGFDTKARPLEIVTDTGNDGTLYIIHADKIRKKYEKLPNEVL